jgi:hypothetical protein
MAQERPTSISFEEFTSTTLRSVRAALDKKPGGPRVFWDPDILIGIVIRPPRDIGDIKDTNITSSGR